ncbi:hypothetical protein BGZ52_005421, partial [Haplosporangium bisporale]
HSRKPYESNIDHAREYATELEPDLRLRSTSQITIPLWFYELEGKGNKHGEWIGDPVFDKVFVNLMQKLKVQPKKSDGTQQPSGGQLIYPQLESGHNGNFRRQYKNELAKRKQKKVETSEEEEEEEDGVKVEVKSEDDEEPLTRRRKSRAVDDTQTSSKKN